MSTHPLLSTSNILNATEKLDSGMLSSVTKKIYLFQRKIRELWTQTDVSPDEEKVGRRTKLALDKVSAGPFADCSVLEPDPT